MPEPGARATGCGPVDINDKLSWTLLSSVLHRRDDDDVFRLLGRPPDETPSFTLQEQQGASADRREAARLLPTARDCVRAKE